MKDNIMIKKFPNGITLHLNPEIEFELLLKEVAAKFTQSRNFFRDAKVALALEGRVFSDDEERLIVSSIHANSDLEIICIVGKNEETERNFVKAIQKVGFTKSEQMLIGKTGYAYDGYWTIGDL